MPTVQILPPFPIFTDVDGNALEDGYIYIGEIGLNPETNPINVFWDAELTIPAAQPIRTLGGYPSRAGTPARLYSSVDDYSITVRNKNSSFIYSSLLDNVIFTSPEWLSSGVVPVFIDGTHFSVPGDQIDVFQVNRRVQAFVTAGTIYGYVESAVFSTPSTIVTMVWDSGALDAGMTVANVAMLEADHPSVPRISSNFFTFLQAGTGAVARTAQSKMRDIVSVFDYMTAAEIADVQARTALIDVTAAIQAAITAGYASGNGVNLYFPPGIYLMSSTITMGNTPSTVAVPVTFTGEKGNSIIKVTAANVNPFLWQGPNPDVDGAGNRTVNIKIDSLRFIGPGISAVNTNSIALKFYGVQGITLINTYSTGWYCAEYYQNVDLVNRFNVWIQQNYNGVMSEATGYALNSSLNSFNSYGGQVGNHTNIGMSYLGGISPCWYGVNFTINKTSLVMSPNHPGGAMVTVAPVISGCYFEGDTDTTIIMGGGNGIVRTPIIEGGFMIAGSATPLITVANASNEAGYGRINIGYDIGFAGSSFITQATSVDKIPVQYSTGMSGTYADGAFGVGGRVPSTSGAGISFPAIQSPSTDVNTLDDYEEGLFTPAITFGGAAVGVTYLVQTGAYVKIGRLVHFVISIYLSNKGTSAGAVEFTGLPFASKLFDWPDKVAVGICKNDRVTTGYGQDLWFINTGSSIVTTTTTDAMTANDSIFRCSGTYLAEN